MTRDDDSLQRINASISFSLEFYRVLVGSFLTAFVPRNCHGKICSVAQNINDDELFHRVAIILNAFSFAVFLYFYYVEINREEWCIRNLDIDPNKTNNNLSTEIDNYPHIKKQIVQINIYYDKIAKLCGGIQIANITASTIDISRQWAGLSSLTPLLSYILLIYMKLSQSHTIASKSLECDRTFSAYMRIARTFNTIDAKILLTPINVEELEKVIESIDK
jgi:hypothetical protein